MSVQVGQPVPHLLTPTPPRHLTCKAHGAKQFLELLELPWGQEQVQGAQLPSYLQLEAEGATWSLYATQAL